MIGLLTALLLAAPGGAAPPASRTTAALEQLRAAAGGLTEEQLRNETVAALQPHPCVRHRMGLTQAGETRVLQQLRAEGLLPPPVEASQAEQQRRTVFPPLGDGEACPPLPQPISVAPGGNAGSHHDWPGGLVAHEAFNLRAGMALADLYEAESGVPVDRDVLTGAVLWHDWAKALVFTWREDGTLGPEGAIAGAGAHHVLGLAEAMARGLPPATILAQACAHAAPVDGDQRKVTGWLRAAAIIARVEWTYPVRPTRECLVSNAADDNWIHAEAAVHAADAGLARLAPRFGHPVAEGAPYRTRLRNPALERLGADRIKALLDAEGDAGLERALRSAGF